MDCSPGAGRITSGVVLRYEKLGHAAGDPVYQHIGDAGFDLPSSECDDVVLRPGERYVFKTGLRFEIPEGYELQVRPRSGLAARYGVTVVNAPGTVDAGYRGEVKVPLINLGEEVVVVRRGDRIAQAVLMPVPRALLVETVRVRTNTGRGECGFGSTGC